jgi:hypothetical protein
MVSVRESLAKKKFPFFAQVAQPVLQNVFIFPEPEPNLPRHIRIFTARCKNTEYMVRNME